MKGVDYTELGRSNGADAIIEAQRPYNMMIQIEGIAPLLLHNWNCEAVAEKSAARKGSDAKKSDDVVSYCRWMDYEGRTVIGFPGEYLRASIIQAAKFRQDPRSPRKSAMDLFKAGVVALDDLVPINNGVESWDYLDRRRVVIQRNSVTRERPAFNKGWTATIMLMVMLPQYIDKSLLRQVIQDAGTLVGVGDFRPTFGRFVTVGSW